MLRQRRGVSHCSGTRRCRRGSVGSRCKQNLCNHLFTHPRLPAPLPRTAPPSCGPLPGGLRLLWRRPLASSAGNNTVVFRNTGNATCRSSCGFNKVAAGMAVAVGSTAAAGQLSEGILTMYECREGSTSPTLHLVPSPLRLRCRSLLTATAHLRLDTPYDSIIGGRVR